MKEAEALMPWTLGAYAGGRSILGDGGAWIYRGADGVRHRLITLSSTTAANAKTITGLVQPVGATVSLHT